MRREGVPAEWCAAQRLAWRCLGNTQASKTPMQSAARPSTAIPPGLPSGLLFHPPPPASLLLGAVPAEQQQEEEEAAKAGKAWDSLRSISWDEVRGAAVLLGPSGGWLWRCCSLPAVDELCMSQPAPAAPA